MKKLLTLVLVDNGTALLLGMKKRGFGQGRWNGFGGKVESGESILEAAHRELEEEVGLRTENLARAAILTFSFASDSACILEVHVFRANLYTGQWIETEEMRPQWFLYEDIPYRDMWPDDQYWLPEVLKGKCIIGSFHFDAPASTDHQAVILDQQIKEVQGFEDGVY